VVRARCRAPFDGGFGGVEDASGFGGPEAEDVAEDERAPLAWWEVLERGHECERDGFARFVACLGPGCVVVWAVEQDVGVGLEPDRLAAAGGLGWFDHGLVLLGAAPLVAQRVEAAVGGDAVEPDA
jgi:hypothetical protein